MPLNEIDQLGVSAFINYVDAPIAIFDVVSGQPTLLTKNRAFDAIGRVDEHIAAVAARCDSSEARNDLARTERTVFELTMRGGNGAFRVHEWAARLVSIAAARKLVVRGIDVTELRETAAIIASMQRTLERNNSLIRLKSSKLEQVLNHVPLSIFSLADDLQIVPPVSPYTYRLLGKGVEQSDFVAIVASGLDKRFALEMRTNLIWVFGKDRTQWDREVLRLPSTVSIADQIYRIRFAPVFDLQEKVHQVVVVLDAEARQAAAAG